MAKKCPNKIKLCQPCCDKCPGVFVKGGMITITDDNDLSTAGIRQIKLTKEQFKQLLKDGKKIIV